MEARKVKGVTMADLFRTDKTNWEYIAIPEENVLGENHASIRVNDQVFEAGKTYLLPPQVVETVKERLRAYSRSCMRVMSPKRDMVAENAVAVGSANPGSRMATPVDATTVQTQ